jgi:hypothetical protein
MKIVHRIVFALYVRLKRCAQGSIAWMDAHAGSMTSLATVVIAVFTVRLFLVGREQAYIAAISFAPRVTIYAKWPKPDQNISLIVTNTGHSSAYNVAIAADIGHQAPGPNFESAGHKMLPLETVDELPQGGTAGYYVVNPPSEGENLYVYGTYSYESRIPETPKKTSLKFCYVARDNGALEPCLTFHVLLLHATESLNASSSVSASVQIVTPQPTPTPETQNH